MKAECYSLTKYLKLTAQNLKKKILWEAGITVENIKILYWLGTIDIVSNRDHFKGANPSYNI